MACGRLPFSERMASVNDAGRISQLSSYCAGRGGQMSNSRNDCADMLPGNKGVASPIFLTALDLSLNFRSFAPVRKPSASVVGLIL